MDTLLENLKLSAHVEDGPLGPYIPAYAAQLLSQGYTRHSSCVKIRLVGGFSRWLDQKNIAADEVITQHASDYLQYRKRSGYRPSLSDNATLARLLELLREQGVITQPHDHPLTPSERLVEEYDSYLEKERVLSLATRVNYRFFAGEFLTARFGKGSVALSRLRATDITDFVRCHARRLNGKRVQLMTTALRSFLRFGCHRGDISLDLAACVPAVASWSLSTLPKSLPLTQVKQVLMSCNRKTAVGRRDYAILMLLARLGLRGGEVVGLTLEDIDWENGLITVKGKNGQPAQLPLPVDVGEAIVAYLRDGRPRVTNNRRLFLRARAPIMGFKSTCAVGSVVKHALTRSGINAVRTGSHQFRHTLATTMLKRGASLCEIGELLRHQHPDTTAIYAKVDLGSLRTLALPWPGGVR